MSAADTSFSLTNGGRFYGGRNPLNSIPTELVGSGTSRPPPVYADNKQQLQSSKINVPVYKYLDIDSTYRNRNNYPNPCDFVIPINYPGRGSTASTVIDPVIGGAPYTGSETEKPGQLVTQTSVNATEITLDASEPTIDNYYVNSILQIGNNFRTITAYTGAIQTATVSPAFPATPAPGTVYYTRLAQPLFYGTVNTAVVPSTTTSFALDNTASTVNGVYVNSYIVFITGPNSGEYSLITSYTGATRALTLQTALTSAPANGSLVEIDALTDDNAQTLRIATNVLGSGSQVSYYEIELLWLSFPNQIFNVSYGGLLSDYPYCYVSLFNEGSPLATQVLYSNNPHSTDVLYKVPVNQYFGSTQFLTLKDSKTKQVIQFHPDQDIRFIVTLPDGNVAQFAESDTMSPNPPNPLFQVNASFAMRRVS